MGLGPPMGMPFVRNKRAATVTERVLPRNTRSLTFAARPEERLSTLPTFP